jgi:hypothetical protein
MTGVLSAEDAAVVDAAVGALEVAEGPVPEPALSALRDPALRAAVEHNLAALGRVLLPVAGGGWVSGYADDVADDLVARGIGQLDPTDRAVLALILLRTVAIPRARGELAGTSWMVDDVHPTTIDELANNRSLTKHQIKHSVRRLRSLGLLRPGHRPVIVPGPAFLRFTVRRNERLWEDLLVLAAPTSSYAQVIRRRRAERRASTASQDGSST